MKLTDELYDLGKKNNNVFVKLDDNYCLVTKVMPVSDSCLEKYINNIRMARKAGINIAEVYDYRLIPETTATYEEGTIKFSKGVFLERLAKGTTNTRFSTNIKLGEEDTIGTKVENYLNALNAYVERLEKRAEMSQYLINKFVDDCIHLGDFGIFLDTRPSNFFFDNKEGVTIINPVSLPAILPELKEYEFFPSHILNAFFGYERPSLFINYEDYSAIPIDLKNRLVAAYSQIDTKIALALRLAGIKDEYVLVNLTNNVSKYTFDKVIETDLFSYAMDAYILEAERREKHPFKMELFQQKQQ